MLHNAFENNFVGVGVESAAGIIEGNTFSDNFQGVGLVDEGIEVADNAFDADHDTYICDDHDNYDLQALAAANIFEEGPLEVDGCLVPDLDEGVLNLTQSTGFVTIQEAVDAADEGDELEARGSFDEVVELDVAGLTLAGAEDASVSGGFLITADEVTVSDLTITDFELQRGEVVGVYIDAEDVSVLGNGFIGNGDHAVADRAVLSASGSSSIWDNEFTSASTGVYVVAGDADIDGNVFDGNNVGVSNDGDGAVDITDNWFLDNAFEAVGLGDASNVVIVGNLFVEDNLDHVCDHDGTVEDLLVDVLADNDYLDHDAEIAGSATKGVDCVTPVQD